jgi:hypothetical protein
MMEEEYQEILSTLELELNRKDMRVLAALIKSQSDPSDYVDFTTLREQLAIDEGGKKGEDPLIYRSLSWLEKKGFIQVDRSERKHGYNSNVVLMHKAFRSELEVRSQELKTELDEVDLENSTISNINPATLAEDFLSLAAGGQTIERPIFAEGLDNIFNLLDNKIYRGLKKGDLVRFTVEWLIDNDTIQPDRLNVLGTLMAKGVRFHGLEHNRLPKKRRRQLKRVTEDYQNKGLSPQFRIFPRKDSTYQFVGRNREGIVLFVSEKPLSATWLPLQSNPDLVNSAIDSFDSDFNAGTDIMEFMEK